MTKRNSWMKITLIGALGLLMFVAPCMAKDNEYHTGTLTKVPLHVGSKKDTGFTDTTDCHSGLVGVNCTGGIVENYDGKLVATMPDSSLVVVRDCAAGATAAAFFLSCSQSWVFVLTEEDGTTTFLERVQFGSGKDKFGDKFGDSAKVLYRIEHKPGVTYIVIPDPDNPNKEGRYTRMKLPKQAAAQKAPPQATDNITAMCASGKLSPEQQTKFCTSTTTEDKKP
jgi:hypothetical protein